MKLLLAMIAFSLLVGVGIIAFTFSCIYIADIIFFHQEKNKDE